MVSDYFESIGETDAEDERGVWAINPVVAALWQQRHGCIAELAAGAPPKKAFGAFLQALYQLVGGRVEWVGEHSGKT